MLEVFGDAWGDPYWIIYLILVSSMAAIGAWDRFRLVAMSDWEHPVTKCNTVLEYPYEAEKPSKSSQTPEDLVEDWCRYLSSDSPPPNSLDDRLF